MSSAKEAQMILDPSSIDAVLEEQARADKEIAKDAEKLVGRVSHDELCNTVHGKLIEGDIDEDLFSISISELEVSDQNKAKQ